MKTIIKRDGRVVDLDPGKIIAAIRACYEKNDLEAPENQTERLQIYAEQVLSRLFAEGGAITVERVQDLVEQVLQSWGELEAAHAYIRYRLDKESLREKAEKALSDRGTVADDFATHFPTPLRAYQYLSKYARFLPEKGRRETWSETVDRVMGFLMEECPAGLTLAQWWELEKAFRSMEVLPSMRLVQMAGPAAKRCHVSIYNCSYLPIKDVESFGEALYILMQGTGVGFSVESRYVSQLPEVLYGQESETVGCPPHHVVWDSTEGWCHALVMALTAAWEGRSLVLDYSRIRPAGSRLKTKGGRASGPEPLKNLVEFARKTIRKARGRQLSSVEVHDILCKIGEIVQVGGVRRAALISLFDSEDREMTHAKDGPFWDTAPHRMQANNSMVWEEAPSQAEFLERLWLPLMKSGSGEPGILNRAGLQAQRPKRRAEATFGCNPCGEIALRPHQFCNLSIAVARPHDTEATLMKKVRLAAIFGTLQSTLTKFNYLRPEWKANCEEERLLGVDITGWCDCPLLVNPTPDLLERLRQNAILWNQATADQLGIPHAAAVTCVKPSGNSSTLLGCSAGLHPREAPYYMRRVRASRLDPLTKLLIEAGVPWDPEVGQTRENYTTAVFHFPEAAPEGAVTYQRQSAAEQLDRWFAAKEFWTEHNPSATIRVRSEEWLSLGAEVYARWSSIGGLSFLPMSDFGYQLAPYQPISRYEYESAVATFPTIPWEKLPYYESEAYEEGRREFACTAGGCEL